MNNRNKPQIALAAGLVLALLAMPSAQATEHEEACVVSEVATDPALDADCDTVLNGADNCPLVANLGQADADGDGSGDLCDATPWPRRLDRDLDGILNTADNCRTKANADQANFDSDMLGDVCDPDDDGDGRADGRDNCLLLYNPAQLDTDRDGDGNACDTDMDGDGTLNGADACPTVAPVTALVGGDCGVLPARRDVDTDGIATGVDNCRTVANPSQANFDNDRLGDACDGDDDNDGVPDGMDEDGLSALPGIDAILPPDDD